MGNDEMNIGRACAIFKDIRNSKESNLEKADAIRRVVEMPTHNSITKEEILDVCGWLVNIAFGDSDRWSRFSESRPDADGDYFTIVRRTALSFGLEDDESHTYPKCGEIWVETDYWSRDEWESIGNDNPYWEVIYWMNPGRIEVKLPDDVKDNVTSMFGEKVVKE